jgi:hypothetical protein
MAIEEARPGDVIVIAGKGHETEQVLSNGAGGLDRTHFDDREIARAILAERRVSSGSSVTKGGSIESKPSRRVAPGSSAGVPRSSPARGRGSGEGTEAGDSGL